MKSLWVEDFGKSEDEDEDGCRPCFESHFDLCEGKYVLARTLSEALIQIECNPNSFDCVLLDINFPIDDASVGNTSDMVYQKFFEHTGMERDFFDYHAAGDGNGAGLLAFWYLIFVARFPKERIAFLSANLSEKDNLLQVMENLREALKQLEKDETSVQRETIVDLWDAYVTQMGSHTTTDLKEMKEDISCREKIEQLTKDIEYLREQAVNASTENQVGGKVIGESSAALYQSFQSELQALGFNLTHAYPKPVPFDRSKGDSIAKSRNAREKERFLKEFVESNNTPYIQFRRNAIELASQIKQALDATSDKNSLIRVFGHYKFDDRKSSYDTDYFKSLLDAFAQLPLIPKDEAVEIKQLLTKLVQCAENCGTPWFKHWLYNGSKTSQELDDIFEYASHSTMKFMRNWIAHGMMKQDVFCVSFANFAVPLILRFIYEIERLPSKQLEEYLKIERDMLTLDSIEDASFLIFENGACAYKKESAHKLIKIIIDECKQKWSFSNNLSAFYVESSRAKDFIAEEKTMYINFICGLFPPRYSIEESTQKYGLDVTLNWAYCRAIANETDYRRYYIEYAYGLARFGGAQ